MKKELKQIYILVLAVVVSLGLVVYASNAKKVQPLSSSNSSLTKLISNNVQPLNDTWGYYVAAGEDVCITGGNCLSTVTGGTGVSDWNYFDDTTIKPTSTVGMFINASSTFNNTLRVNGLLSGDGVTLAQQNFWNGTSTWTAYDTNWNRNYNATTTLNGFTNNQANWNTAYGWGDHSIAGYYAAASFNTDWAGQANATTTTDSDSTWTLHNNYPAACSAGDFVTAIGDTLTCSTPPSGGGSGGGFWATTTAESFIYNTPVANTVLIGSNATTTNLNLDLEVIGDSLLGGNNTSTGLFVIGNDSAGDSNIKLRDTWIFGLDDSDDDNLVFSSGATLGSSVIAKFTTGGLFASSTLFTKTTTTNLAILGANAANCDLKATTAGVVYCGSDADSGAGTGSNWNYFDATTIKPTSTVGVFINASSTFNSTLRVNGGITGALTGNASTASALAADPSDCGAGTVATAIAANGSLTCSITPLISGGTLTTNNVCQYDGTGIDCDLTKDSTGDCASGAVCLGDHTHSTYATLANPTFTGLQILPDARVAMLNSTTTNIGTLTVITASSFPANDIVDAEVSDTLTASNLVASGSVVADAEVDDSITINTALQGIFSGDLRVATLNATTTKTDNLTVNTTLSLPANAVTDAMVSDTLTCSDLQAASAVVADSEVVDALTISTSIEGIFTGNIRTNAINATTTKTDTLTVYGNSTMAAVTTTNLAVSGLLNCDTIDTDASGSFKCGTDASTAGSAGSNWDYFDSTTIKPTTTVGFFISASSTINSTLRVTGSLTAPGGITGALTGNASTASALFADPSDCAAGTVATAIAANGSLTCSITPLISGGTLTSANVCQYDGTGIDCDLVKDGSGDCASGAVCLGDHTHSSYAPTANPTFTGLQVTPDLRAAMLNSTTTKVGTLTVFTGSTLSGLSIISDGRLAVINSTTTKADTLTVNTSATINAATLNGLSVIADGRIAMLNSTTTNVGTLTVGGNNIPAYFYPSFSYSTTTWVGTTTIPLGPAFIAETWSEVRCLTDAGTVNVVFTDGTNNMNYIAASTTASENALTTNNSFTAGEKRAVILGSPATSPTSVSCTVRKAY